MTDQDLGHCIVELLGHRRFPETEIHALLRGDTPRGSRA